MPAMQPGAPTRPAHVRFYKDRLRTPDEWESGKVEHGTGGARVQLLNANLSDRYDARSD
jgi:hypothetical protein